MRSILVTADKAATLDDRIETALALARTFDGHVTFQIATPFAELALWEPFGGAAITAEAINQVREADEKLAVALDQRLAHQDVAFDVVIVDEGRAAGIAGAARFADLIVTSLEDPALEEIALGTNAPVLALPKGRPLLDFSVPELVCWDGGQEAAAALRAAVPLLARASQVHLLTVREKSDDYPAAEAAEYLSRHGVHAETREVECQGTIARTIEQQAAALGAGLVVMGLFGKSRLRELLFGGVSRALLDRAELPLFFAH